MASGASSFLLVVGVSEEGFEPPTAHRATRPSTETRSWQRDPPSVVACSDVRGSRRLVNQSNGNFGGVPAAGVAAKGTSFISFPNTVQLGAPAPPASQDILATFAVTVTGQL